MKTDDRRGGSAPTPPEFFAGTLWMIHPKEPPATPIRRGGGPGGSRGVMHRSGCSPAEPYPAHDPRNMPHPPNDVHPELATPSTP